MIVREKVLITVKTYPTLSNKHIELVCTAGIRENGLWARICPTPFRFLNCASKFKKYDNIELDMQGNPNDPRPESYRPTSRILPSMLIRGGSRGQEVALLSSFAAPLVQKVQQ